MRKEETESGGTAYTGLYEEDGITWNILVRGSGSISLYGTRSGDSVHYVIFDTLDDDAPNENAQYVIAHLKDMAEGITLLLAAVNDSSPRASE